MVGEKLKHYQIEELVGKGGMGVVYKARDSRLGRPVALKVLKEEITTDPDRRRRFLQEARSASAVTHPSIAQVYDVGDVDGTLFIALEFVEGQTLHQLILDRELDLLRAVEIAIQTTEGLGRAHSAGIVHRDIKSDNIMVTPDGHAKILDFGLAKLLDTSVEEDSETHLSIMETMAQTQAGMVMGTVAYMSPEQARGKAVDHRSDLFSMGIVVYEMVTGELPFKGSSPLDTMHAIAFEEVRPVTVTRRDLPPALQRILSRSLRKRPEDRYQDAAAMVSDLKQLKNTVETGPRIALGFGGRLHDLAEWIRFSLPYGISGGVATLVVAALLAVLIAVYADWGTLVLLLLIGLPVYRYIRNRRDRMVQRIVSKVSKIPEVQVVVFRENLVTVGVDYAKASVHRKLTGLVEAANKKLFHGDPLNLAVRDDLTEDDIRGLLREPGVRYVRDDF